MTKLILDERPIQVLPKLATKIGLNESIILQQIHYWLLKKINSKEGYYWTYNSYREWKEQFPFWSESTIKRTILSLEEKDLLISGVFNEKKYDKTKWYRINYEELKKYEETEIFDGKVKDQNEPSLGSKWSDGKVNMTQPIPKITTKTNTNNNKRPNFTSSDMQLAELLYYCITQNNPSHKKPNLESWAKTFRLMREQDNRTHEQIEACIKWCQSDSFWYKNILSADKLRKKYDQLSMHAGSSKNNNLKIQQQVIPAPPEKLFDPNSLFD